MLYQGPVKVRLLKQLEGAQAVPEETVNRYRDDLDLQTLTDAPSPNWLGRFANFLFWTDIVIAFTNLIHSLLGLLSQVDPEPRAFASSSSRSWSAASCTRSAGGR